MKKFIVSLLALATVGLLSASAASHQAASFLNAQSISVTNTIGVTNFTALGNTVLTNAVGTIYTNLAGSRVITTGYGTNDSVNLLKTVPLWTDAQGQPIAVTYTNQAPGATIMPGPFFSQIYIRLVGGSGANTATTFVFAPVPGDSPYESNASADLITVTVTPNGTTQVTSLTKVDASKVVGCRGLKLLRVIAGDTDASSNVTVLECKLVGFVP